MPRAKTTTKLDTAKQVLATESLKGFTRDSLAKHLHEVSRKNDDLLQKTAGLISETYAQYEQLQAAIEAKKEELKVYGECADANQTLEKLQAELEAMTQRYNNDSARLKAEFDARTELSKAQLKADHERMSVLLKADLEMKQREFDSTCQSKLRELDIRNANLVEREKKLDTMEKQISEFPSQLEKEVSKAKLAVSTEMRKEFEHAAKLSEASNKVTMEKLITDVASARATANAQATTIEQLSQQLKVAHDNLLQVTKEAFQSQSSAKALAAVQEMHRSEQPATPASRR